MLENADDRSVTILACAFDNTNATGMNTEAFGCVMIHHRACGIGADKVLIYIVAMLYEIKLELVKFASYGVIGICGRLSEERLSEL
jgi:hypothetical protein